MSTSINNSEEPPSKKLTQLAQSQEIFSLEQFSQAPISLFPTTNRQENFLKDIKIKVIADIKACQEIFEAFSPKDTLFSLWSFRYPWYLAHQHQPCFFLFYFQEKPTALLPLWFEADKNRFAWFGSKWQEENTFWTLNKNLIPVILSVCPPKTLLNALKVTDPALIKLFNLLVDDPKFVLDLKTTDSLDDFLSRFKKKKRYNLCRDRRIIQSQGVEIIYNRFSDLKTLIKLSNRRFGKESSWNEKMRRIFSYFIDHPTKQFKLRMLTFKIGSQIAGVDLNAIYKNTYYCLKCGYDIQNFPGIGNYATLTDIQDALALRAKRVDFLQTVGALENSSWKASWFTTSPLYKFKKEAL